MTTTVRSSALRDPTRHRRGLVLRLTILGALLVFLILAEAPERTRLWSAFFDFGHVPLFGVIALVVRGLIAGRGTPETGEPPLGEAEASPLRPTHHRSAAAFVVAIALGAATEVLQAWVPSREASLVDFLRDVAGAGAFLLIAEAVRFNARTAGGSRRTDEPPLGEPEASPLRPTHHQSLAALVAACVLLLAGGTELIVTAAANVARYRALPALFRMDGSWWERPLIHAPDGRLTFGATWAGGPPSAGGDEPLAVGAGGPSAAGAGATAGPARFARLDLKPALYSGISLVEPYPDWRGYRRLVLTIASDLDAPLLLNIRIHDAAHDQRYANRFNRQFSVRPGMNRLVIPIDDVRTAPDRREMDLARIRGIVLFVHQLDHPTHIYLGPIVLE